MLELKNWTCVRQKANIFLILNLVAKTGKKTFKKQRRGRISLWPHSETRHRTKDSNERKASFFQYLEADRV